jgi:DNA topoisomerase-2
VDAEVQYVLFLSWQGRIEKTGATVEGSTYSTTGVIDVLDEHAVHITELPIHCWTLDYKNFLESFVCCNTKELYIEVAGNPEYNTLQVTWLSIHKDDFLKIMIQLQMVRLIRHDDTSFEFKLTLDKENMEIVVQEGLEKKLNLITAVGTTNMRLIDRTGLTIRKYKTPEESEYSQLEMYGQKKKKLYTIWLLNLTISVVLEEFFDLRLEYYEKRKVDSSLLLLLSFFLHDKK